MAAANLSSCQPQPRQRPAPNRGPSRSPTPPPRYTPTPPPRAGQVGSKGQSAYEKMGTELRGMMDANANATQPKRCGDRSRRARH